MATLKDPVGDPQAARPPGVQVLSEGGAALLATRPDTYAFSERLVQLAELDQHPGSAEQLQQVLPEETAACSLFLWEEPLLVTRAPGCSSHLKSLLTGRSSAIAAAN